MRIQGGISRLMAAALLSGGLAAGAMMATSGLRAQTPAPGAEPAPAPAPPRLIPAPAATPAPAPAAVPAGMVPATAVPFYAEWASSPHADAKAEPFIHWNKEGSIPVACARCHSTPGFQDYLGADGSAAGKVDRPAPVGTVITCIACHNDKTRALTSVTFASGMKVENQGADARCMTCHQGVSSTNEVNSKLAGIADDAVEPKLDFINVHYAAAGAMLVGTLARVGYEYAGKTYAGRYQHREPYTRCTACHELHTVAAKVNDCIACHKEVTDKASLRRIRTSKDDRDGDGDVIKGVAQEIDNLRGKLKSAIMDYAKTVAGKTVAYDDHVYPYFFFDTNDNRVADKDEPTFPNRYKAWTPRLMKAAYNYQFVTKDPGAYAHNPAYAIQLLQDSLADLGSAMKADFGKAKRP